MLWTPCLACSTGLDGEVRASLVILLSMTICSLSQRGADRTRCWQRRTT